MGVYRTWFLRWVRINYLIYACQVHDILLYYYNNVIVYSNTDWLLIFISSPTIYFSSDLRGYR